MFCRCLFKFSETNSVSEAATSSSSSSCRKIRSCNKQISKQHSPKRNDRSYVYCPQFFTSNFTIFTCFLCTRSTGKATAPLPEAASRAAMKHRPLPSRTPSCRSKEEEEEEAASGRRPRPTPAPASTCRWRWPSPSATAASSRTSSSWRGRAPGAPCSSANRAGRRRGRATS